MSSSSPSPSPSPSPSSEHAPSAAPRLVVLERLLGRVAVVVVWVAVHLAEPFLDVGLGTPTPSDRHFSHRSHCTQVVSTVGVGPRSYIC